MKIQRLFASVAVASALLSTGAMAADGTINFTGNVTASACTVTGAAQAGGVVSTTTLVTLPSVSLSALTTVGAFAGNTAFSIYLTGCEAQAGLDNVFTAFTTTSPAATDSNVMENTQATSPAGGLGIAILKGDTLAQIDLNGGTNTDSVHMLPVAGNPGPMQLNYVAAYKVLSLPVSAGGVQGQVNYTLSYN